MKKRSRNVQLISALFGEEILLIKSIFTKRVKRLLRKRFRGKRPFRKRFRGKRPHEFYVKVLSTSIY